MRGSVKARSAWVRIAYYSAFPTGVFFLFLGFFPHLFFTSEGELYDSISYFGFLENIRNTCFAVLTGTANASPDAVRFSVILTVLWGLTCLFLAWYAVFQLATVLLAAFALIPRAASPVLNRWKRIYRIFVPNRGAFVFLTVLPALLSCLPWLFTALYKTVLGQTAVLHYDWLPDVIPLTLLSLASAGLFLATLRDQKDLKLDLFRIYRTDP